MHRWVAAGRSPHFTLDEQRLADVARYVAGVTRAAYPDLRIPSHSRWRHFCAGGVDRWSALRRRIGGRPLEQARCAIDLATVSVLLDAGAGDAWRYREPQSGHVLARSEGLAVASLDMFRAGAFSSDPDRRCAPTARAGAHRRRGAGAPLPGRRRQSAASGWSARPLLRRLGAALAARPDLFGSAPARPGHLVDIFSAAPADGSVGGGAPCRAARQPVGDLAGGARGRRRADRRCRTPSGGAHR